MTCQMMMGLANTIAAYSATLNRRAERLERTEDHERLDAGLLR